MLFKTQASFDSVSQNSSCCGSLVCFCYWHAWQL